MSPADPLLRLLARFAEEGVEYVLVGGQAVRLNGYVRATEDVDVLVPASRANGERIKRAMSFLPAAAALEPAWFEPQAGEVENIRVADELLVDLLFAAMARPTNRFSRISARSTSRASRCGCSTSTAC